MALILEKAGAMARLMLNRPEARNAVDPETVLELAAAWEEYRDDGDLRCAIITGAGDRSFCSGADLKELIPLLSGAKKPATYADRRVSADPTLIHRALLRGFELNKPVIAAVNGDAIAGGMELLYATDIRVCSRDARLGLQEVKWSIFPAGGSTVWLPRQLPYARAMEILLTGELMSAQEAFELGLLNRVVPVEQVMAEAERFASIIVKNGPVAVSAIKKSVHAAIGLPLAEGLARELEMAIPVFLSEDIKEGPRAFQEKREPRYRGR